MSLKTSVSWLKWLEGTKSSLTAQISWTPIETSNLNRLNSQLNTGHKNKRPLLCLDRICLQGRLDSDWALRVVPFKSPQKSAWSRHDTLRQFPHNLFTWRLGCLRNNTHWIMQMWRDKPVAVQPVPPDLGLWNALLHSLHVRRPSTTLANTVCVAGCAAIYSGCQEGYITG